MIIGFQHTLGYKIRERKRNKFTLFLIGIIYNMGWKSPITRNKGVVVKTFFLFIMLCFMLVSSPANTSGSRNINMYNGVIAMRGYMRHVNYELTNRLIKEVIEVTSKQEYTWISPELLLGLAINESDLRWWVISGGNYLRDCGICQNHVPQFRDTYWERQKLCIELSKSTKLSFEYAAKELTDIRNRWCVNRYKEPVQGDNESNSLFRKRALKYKLNNTRCVLNVYNQGPRYFGRKYDSGWYYRNNYWLRSYCFTVGLMTGKKPAGECRKATSIRWIEREYNVILEELEYGQSDKEVRS